MKSKLAHTHTHTHTDMRTGAQDLILFYFLQY